MKCKIKFYDIGIFLSRSGFFPIYALKSFTTILDKYFLDKSKRAIKII